MCGIEYQVEVVLEHVGKELARGATKSINVLADPLVTVGYIFERGGGKVDEIIKSLTKKIEKLKTRQDSSLDVHIIHFVIQSCFVEGHCFSIQIFSMHIARQPLSEQNRQDVGKIFRALRAFL